jgi:hypothetical protein
MLARCQLVRHALLGDERGEEHFGILGYSPDCCKNLLSGVSEAIWSGPLQDALQELVNDGWFDLTIGTCQFLADPGGNVVIGDNSGTTKG